MKWQIEHFLQSEAVAILEAMGDAISIQDPVLKIIYQNPHHIKLMGNHLGRHCYEAYQHRDSACPDCHLLLTFKTGRVHRKIGSTKHSKRGFIHAEIISSPVRDADGKIVAGIEAVRDITERMLLNDKINAITTDLEQKTWRLMASNKELESFSYTLSHDVKNYLSRISVASQMLMDNSASEPGESNRLLAESISEACTAMEEMIDAILTLSSTGRNGIVLDEVNLASLAEEVATELRCQYPDHRVEFDVAAELVAIGDKQLLKLMLRNLLGNAWKYTENRPDARVSFFSEEHDDKPVFVIQDNGAGFDMKEAGRLFKPFSRLSGAKGVKGKGIGLATVRRIILCHGGDIWGQGTPGKGATFYFTLPTQKE